VNNTLIFNKKKNQTVLTNVVSLLNIIYENYNSIIDCF